MLSSRPQTSWGKVHACFLLPDSAVSFAGALWVGSRTGLSGLGLSLQQGGAETLCTGPLTGVRARVTVPVLPSLVLTTGMRAQSYVGAGRLYKRGRARSLSQHP